MKISIPKPCHEDWTKMTPADKGNFCNSCAKIVVDFTKMKDFEVKQYFTEHAKQKTCGRFLNSQLERPYSDKRTFSQKLYTGLDYAKTYTQRFAVALVLVFGSTLFVGCNWGSGETLGKISTPHTIGDIIETQDSTAFKPETADSTQIKTEPLQTSNEKEIIFEDIGDVELGEPEIEQGIIDYEEIKTDSIESSSTPSKIGKVLINTVQNTFSDSTITDSNDTIIFDNEN